MGKGNTSSKGKPTKPSVSTGTAFDPGVAYPNTATMPAWQADQIDGYNTGSDSKFRAGVNDFGAAQGFANHVLGVTSSTNSAANGGSRVTHAVGNGRANALAAIQTLYDQWKGAGINQDHLNLLNKFNDQALQTGNTALDQLRTALQAQQASPYQGVNLAPAVQASNPMQAYLQAQGIAGDPAVTSMQQMLQGQNDVAQANAQQLMSNNAIMDQAARQSRLGDLNYASTAFQQELGNNKLLNQQRLADQAQARKDEFMKTALEYALKYGINLKKKGFDFNAPSTQPVGPPESMTPVGGGANLGPAHSPSPGDPLFGINPPPTPGSQAEMEMKRRRMMLDSQRGSDRFAVGNGDNMVKVY